MQHEHWLILQNFVNDQRRLPRFISRVALRKMKKVAKFSLKSESEELSPANHQNNIDDDDDEERPKNIGRCKSHEMKVDSIRPEDNLWII